MTFVTHIAVTFLLALPAAAEPATNILSGSVDVYDPSIDYFPSKVTLKHARGFTVEYHPHYKVLRVLNPWKGSTETFTYLLIQRGTPDPGGFETAHRIQVPIARFVSLSTTYLSHLEAIGARESLVGMSATRFAYAPWVRERIERGETIETGTGGGINREAIVASEPDLVMTYGSGNPSGDAHPKLMEMGIPVAINAEFMEQTPLGRAAWMKYTALFFNREAEVEQAFARIEMRYNELSLLGRAAMPKPTVFTNISWQGLWHASGGKSFIAFLLADAGADYTWKDTPGDRSMPLDFETVFERAQNADFWINTGVWRSIDEAISSDERYNLFAAFRNRQMYNHIGRVNEHGGNDYFESGIANPHFVLADLIKIFHPDLLPDHTLFYYRILD